MLDWVSSPYKRNRRMMLGPRSILLLLVLLSSSSSESISSVEAENRLSRFFSTKFRRGGNERNAASSEEMCLDNEQVKGLLDALEQSEGAKHQAELASRQAAERLEHLQQQMQEFRTESDMQIRQITESSEPAQQIAAALEESQHYLAEFRGKYDQQLEQLRVALAQRESELLALRSEMEHKTRVLTEDADRRVEQVRVELAGSADCSSQLESMSEKVAAIERDLSAAVSDKSACQSKMMMMETEVAEALQRDIERETSFKAKLEEGISSKATIIEQKWQEGYAQLELDLQKQVDETKSSLESKLASTIASHEKKLKEITAAHEKKIADLTTKKDAAAKKEMQDAVSKHNEKVKKLNARIEDLTAQVKNFKDEKKQLLTKQSNLQKKLDKVVKDAEHWENLFHERPYVNFTYISQDATKAAKVATDTAVLKLGEARAVAEKHYESVRKISVESYEKAKPYVDKARVIAKPHLQTAQILYGQHLKPHVEKAKGEVMPHYNEKVAPVLNRIRDEVTTSVSTTLDILIADYGRVCPTVVKSLKENDAPESIVASVKDSCKDPKGSVYFVLKVIAFFLAFLFRRVLFRLTKFLVKTVWFLTPLGFLLWLLSPSKKKQVSVKGKPQKQVKQEAAAPTKKEDPVKVSADTNGSKAGAKKATTAKKGGKK